MQPIIKRERVRLEEKPRRAKTGAAVPNVPAHGKHAELVRVDGEVRAIRFRCDCGEETVLELEYEGSAAPATRGDSGASS